MGQPRTSIGPAAGWRALPAACEGFSRALSALRVSVPFQLGAGAEAAPARSLNKVQDAGLYEGLAVYIFAASWKLLAVIIIIVACVALPKWAMVSKCISMHAASVGEHHAHDVDLRMTLCVHCCKCVMSCLTHHLRHFSTSTSAQVFSMCLLESSSDSPTHAAQPSFCQSFAL